MLNIHVPHSLPCWVICYSYSRFSLAVAATAITARQSIKSKQPIAYSSVVLLSRININMEHVESPFVEESSSGHRVVESPREQFEEFASHFVESSHTVEPLREQFVELEQLEQPESDSQSVPTFYQDQALIPNYKFPFMEYKGKFFNI